MNGTVGEDIDARCWRRSAAWLAGEAVLAMRTWKRQDAREDAQGKQRTNFGESTSMPDESRGRGRTSAWSVCVMHGALVLHRLMAGCLVRVVLACCVLAQGPSGMGQRHSDHGTTTSWEDQDGVPPEKEMHQDP